MKVSIALAGVLLLQSGPMRVDLVSASPEHLRFERELDLPDEGGGWACAVLDANVFAHAASRSTDDLRVFRTDGVTVDAEVPFLLAVSEAQPDEDVQTQPIDVQVRGNQVGFALAMPNRAYSMIELKLAATDFDGSATVTGLSRGGAVQIPLGSFAVFDRSTEGLGRSTSLSLPESRFARVHVELEMWKPTGEALPGLQAAVIEGAKIPPSREAQTLYTMVAESKDTHERNARTISVLRIPAHVPVERVSFALQDSFASDFRRGVTLTARPDGARDAATTETVTGAISTAHLRGRMGQPEVFRSLEIDAVLAASLRTDATLEVAIDNESKPPLPMRMVKALMRQRTVCFNAEPGSRYTLRYGDATLPAPMYAAAASNRSDRKTLVARLGTEVLNPAYTARVERGSYPGRHPELLWVLLVIALSGMGATGMHAVRQIGRG